MVILPNCACCESTECFTASDRMVVTLSGLPHENYGYNRLPMVNGWPRGLTYLDAYNGEYVLYKTHDQPNDGSTLYSGECSYSYFDGVGDSVANGSTTFGIVIKYRHGYNRFGTFVWDRTVTVRVLGGIITWADQGSVSAPSASNTYIASDLTVNASPETQIVGGYLVVAVPWTLTSSTCSIAEYDASTHSSALKPCECFNLPSGWGSTDTLYKSTCLTYNGTADPGTDNYSSVYHPHGNCDPSAGSLYCSPIVATYTQVVGAYTLKWWDYGTDEIDITVSDMTLAGTTLSIAGTYTLPYGGLLGGSLSGTIPCSGGGTSRLKVLGPSWSAAFPFTHSGSTHAVLFSVSLARSEESAVSAVLLYPSSRRLYVGATVVGPSGILNGASTFWQSDGLQAEDTYGCGNMPTVTGGDGVSGTKYILGCTGTTYQWTWSVSQA